ncbi:MAG TPA: VWA domain-containing protein [Pyrinomonadaceae bacterium]|nr:VWA domain-containing protein [Pyrinomonadaceae bacterium]
MLPCLLVIVILQLPLCAQANKVAPPKQTAADEQDPIKITTEEVRLPVLAVDEKGRFDVGLVPDDILLLEDGVPQQVRSVRHIPSHVLLLLDTGGGDAVGRGGLSKSVSLTRRVAQEVVATLTPDNLVAVVQTNNRVELLQNWTADREAVQKVLDTKLIGAKRSRFSEAVAFAAGIIKEQPEGSRHVVMITDGVDTPGERSDRREATRQLIAARAVVHVISYTEYVRQKEDKSRNDVKSDRAAAARQSRQGIERAGIDPTMPPGQSRGGIGGGGIGGGIVFDPEMRRVRKAYEEEAKRSEQNLSALAEETGARLLLPKSTAEMIAGGREVARDIGAQYVVAYTPKRPLAAARAGEYRRIALAPRRIGLQMRTRRGYVVPE